VTARFLQSLLDEGDKEAESTTILQLGAAALLLVSSSAAGASERFVRHEKHVPNRYIVEVAVKDRTVIHEHAATLPPKYSGRLVDVFDHVLGGFVVEMSERDAIQLSRHPAVAGVHEIPLGEPLAVETAMSWGRDRIDVRTLSLDSLYNYYYTGSGVTAYVIDTGVTITGDLIGRIAERFDFTGTGLNDCYTLSPRNGHGTQVASTIGGATYGLTKSVRLVSLKAFGCSTGTGTDRVIAALNWIVANRPATELSVANISLRYSADVNLDAAVRDAVAAGVVVVAGAGNAGDDACGASPSRTGNPAFIANNPNGYSAITVAASDQNDQVAWWSTDQWSSTGPCVDLFAPGGPGLTAQGVRSVDTGWSGTSAASPHVAAIAVLTLGRYGDVTPGMVESYVLQNATPSVIANNANGLANIRAETPNRLIYQVQAPKRRACCS
jgi:subtilisin family serine protease